MAARQVQRASPNGTPFGDESSAHQRRASRFNGFRPFTNVAAIQQGEYYQDGEKANVILAVHRDEESHRRFVAVMKITNKSCEVWLSSFYRCHPRQIKRYMRKHKRLVRFGK